PAGLKILEQNYEYDLLTSAKLMEKYVGKKVRLYQSNGTYQEVTLLSTNGPVYEINGQIHRGHYGQVVLPALTDNLVSKPTLVGTAGCSRRPPWLLPRPTPAGTSGKRPSSSTTSTHSTGARPSRTTRPSSFP